MAVVELPDKAPVTLPVTSPVTSPVKAPSKVSAVRVSDPTVHLSRDSSQRKDLLAAVPRSISIPPFSVGVPEAFPLISIILSAKEIVSVLTVVVVPLTVRSPARTKELNATLSVVPTDCPIETIGLLPSPVPPAIDTPVPAATELV